MNKLALVQRMASDLTGKEAEETQFLTMTVRSHPELDEPRAFDVLPDEVKGLKSSAQVVVIELKDATGQIETKMVTVDDFKKVVSDDKLKSGRSVRGRRPGWSPRNGNDQ